MAIKLQFVCQDALTSQVIALFSAGHLSHVDALLPSGLLYGARSDRIGKVPAGVRLRVGGYETFSRQVIFTIPCTIDQQKAFWKFLWEQNGKPYDYEAIWGFALGRDWREDDSWICSELQAAALEACGVFPKLYIACNKITPVALAGLVSAIGGTAATIK